MSVARLLQHWIHDRQWTLLDCSMRQHFYKVCREFLQETRYALSVKTCLTFGPAKVVESWRRWFWYLDCQSSFVGRQVDEWLSHLRLS